MADNLILNYSVFLQISTSPKAEIYGKKEVHGKEKVYSSIKNRYRKA